MSRRGLVEKLPRTERPLLRRDSLGNEIEWYPIHFEKVLNKYTIENNSNNSERLPERQYHEPEIKNHRHRTHRPKEAKEIKAPKVVSKPCEDLIPYERPHSPANLPKILQGEGRMVGASNKLYWMQASTKSEPSTMRSLNPDMVRCVIPIEEKTKLQTRQESKQSDHSKSSHKNSENSQTSENSKDSRSSSHKSAPRVIRSVMNKEPPPPEIGLVENVKRHMGRGLKQLVETNTQNNVMGQLTKAMASSFVDFILPEHTHK